MIVFHYMFLYPGVHTQLSQVCFYCFGRVFGIIIMVKDEVVANQMLLY